jgi:glutaredoxin
MSAYDTPTQECPYCKSNCEADFVDNGVGMVQCGPYHCYECGASQIGPEMKFESLEDENGHYVMGGIVNKEDFTETEIKIGWYEPNRKKISPYANTVNGELVDHEEAKKMYDVGLLDEKEYLK